MDVVTGAFGYIGRYIAARLLSLGRPVKTITTHIDKPNPFGPAVSAHPYDFDWPDRLEQTLNGVDTLYNTYWIRFPYQGMTFDKAVDNTQILLQAAARAGVRKIVHISVTRASADSPLPYYRGKGQQEELVKAIGLPYAIVRPTLVFGREDILVNNIAWLIRTFPLFPIPGDGLYRVQPVFVDDLAAIAVDHAAHEGSETVDAIGPETYTYREMVGLIAAALNRHPRLVRTPPWLNIFLGRLMGLFLRDIILTRNELRGLMDSLLTSGQKPNGPTSFAGWIKANSDTLGSTYSSELGRHWRWRRTN